MISRKTLRLRTEPTKYNDCGCACARDMGKETLEFGERIVTTSYYHYWDGLDYNFQLFRKKNSRYHN